MQDSILVLAPFVPIYDRSIGALRFYHIIDRLAQTHRVVFLGQSAPGLEPYHDALNKKDITVYTIDKEHRLFSPESDDLVAVMDLTRLLRDHAFKYVIMAGYETATHYVDVIKKHSPQSLLIMDIEDLVFHRMAQDNAPDESPDQAWAIELQRRKELTIYNQADVLLTATAPARLRLSQYLDHPDIRVVPPLHPLVTDQKLPTPDDPLFYETWYGVEALERQIDTLITAPPSKQDGRQPICRISSPYRRDEEAEWYAPYHIFTAFQPNLSIVIPVFNGLRYTQECVKAIRQNTQIPYDIILIDNGSTDGTAAWAEQACIPTIRNEENKGFGYACNQGMMASHSAFVVLLNNDVIVSQGWAEHMVAHLKADAGIGLIGPCTNYAGSKQQIEVHYTDKDAFTQFSDELYQQQQGKRETVDHLVGLCLMMPRRVVMDIGLFDERFGLGNYEDNDYAVRTRMAGYTLAIARDIFVHHYGSRTFIENKIDYDCAMKKNKNYSRKNGDRSHIPNQPLKYIPPMKMCRPAPDHRWRPLIYPPK